MINVFETIQKIVEEQTGFQCIYENKNIQDGQVMVSIKEIEKTGVEGQYRVFGKFIIKTGIANGWNELYQVLDLHITDTRCIATIVQEGNGFALMSVDFSLVIDQELKRKFKI